MSCPACGAAMAEETFDGHYGRRVVINLCKACRGLWFDGLESLQLTPGATLRLFERFAGEPPVPPPAAGRCPRCGAALALAHDAQRDTPFSYLRCPAEHGHYITFFQFLREKNFVRRLSPAEIATLRDTLGEVHCSNCGAPVSLDRDAVCGYCHTPLAMLDPHQCAETVNALQAAEAHRTAVDPTLPARLAIDRLSVLGADFRVADGDAGPPALGLVEAGLRVLLGALPPF
ncbi:MAG TPA: zf-TFIIB domain-containing protein [Methylomirabilota bacterium]|nr:zf-TFIIB domain-containing protein [Methylomirabilota bacterium]